MVDNSERPGRSVKHLMLRLIARTVDQQRQIADFQEAVGSLTERLENVTAQMNEFQQKFHDSGYIRCSSYEYK